MARPPTPPRLRGLETEYCLRFTPEPGCAHPGNRRIYDAILAAVGTRTPLRDHDGINKKTFLGNGGALNYESLPSAPRGGLLEGATPECAGPRQLLTWQRAQERLLLDSLDDARQSLRADGFDGELGLLKNCRDALGNVYGAQESYDCQLARGPALWLYRAVLCALLPGFIVVALLSFGLIVCGVVAVLAAMIVEAVRQVALGLPEDGIDTIGDEEFVELAQMAIIPWYPLLAAQAAALRLFGFRRVQRGAMSFFVSRCVMTGCGMLDGEGRFSLSEKAPDMRHTMRLDMRQSRRAVLDTGNLLKPMQTLVVLQMHDAFAAFRARQRLQVGLGDSNVATVAEYLKIATTGLVIDMAEAGWLEDAPRPEDPIKALRTWSGDDSLQARTPMRDDAPRTALEMQRYYLGRAQDWIATSTAPSIEEIEAVRLWRDVLDTLERNPDDLIGRLDWVTKRWLLRTAGEGLPADARAKIALRYHELGTGYFAQLEAHDIAPDLLDPDEVRAAMTTPPDDSPAALRAEILRGLTDAEGAVRVSWDHVRVGGRFGKIIRLADFRRR